MDINYLVYHPQDTIIEGQKIPQDAIKLTEEDKDRIYGPWKFSVIIKAEGKRFNHHYLWNKLDELWKIQDPFPLIDLGYDFYTAKFNQEEHQKKALQQGPWFVAGAYLSIRNWTPNFIPSKSKVLTTVIWVRLPGLPTEFYNRKILEKAGRKIGQLVKIDSCTSATLHGRYARICIQIPMDT